MRFAPQLAFAVILFAAADARAWFDFVGEPFDAGPVNIGTTSAPFRVTVRVTGEAGVDWAYVEVDTQPPFEIVASGGMVENGERFWWYDVIVTPDENSLDGGCYAFFDVRWYSPYSDNDFTNSTYVSCQARRVPFSADWHRFTEQTPINVPRTETITITNTSAGPLQVDGFLLDAPFTAQLHGTLPITVPPEGTFDVDVTFVSSNPGRWYSTNVYVVSGAEAHYAVPIQAGTYDAVRVAVDYEWSDVPPGTVARHAGELVNYTDKAVTITYIEPCAVCTLEGVGVGTVIAPFARAPITLAFTPTDSHDSEFRGLEFDVVGPTRYGVYTHNDWVERLRVTTADAMPDDLMLDFGFIDAGTGPITKQLVIQPKLGATSLACTVDGSAFASSACPVSLADEATATIDVTFTPPSIGGFVEGELTFAAASLAGGPSWSRAIHVQLAAYVVAPVPALAIVAPSFADTYRFPSTPSVAEIVVANQGAQPIGAPAAAVIGADFVLVASPSGAIAPGGTATYRVAFAPIGVGPRHGTFALATGQEIALVGTGTLRPISAPVSLDLGDVPYGVLRIGEIVVTNAGGEPHTITAIAALPTSGDPQFHVDNLTSTVIPAGGQRTIPIEFFAQQCDTSRATLEISYDGDPAPQTIVDLVATATCDHVTPPETGADEPSDSVIPPESGADEMSESGGSGSSGGCSASGSADALGTAFFMVLLIRRRSRTNESERGLNPRR